MIDKNRVKELITSLTREDDTPDRIEAYNELLNGFDDDYATKLNEAENKVKELEERYRNTFRSILEKDTGREDVDVISTKEETVVEENESETTWDDIFK